MKPALCFADLAVPLYLLFVSPGVTEGCEHETFISLRPTQWVACGLYFVLLVIKCLASLLQPHCIYILYILYSTFFKIHFAFLMHCTFDNIFSLTNPKYVLITGDKFQCRASSCRFNRRTNKIKTHLGVTADRYQN